VYPYDNAYTINIQISVYQVILLSSLATEKFLQTSSKYVTFVELCTARCKEDFVIQPLQNPPKCSSTINFDVNTVKCVGHKLSKESMRLSLVQYYIVLKVYFAFNTFIVETGM
jgi:hypothetical protein